MSKGDDFGHLVALARVVEMLVAHEGGATCAEAIHVERYGTRALDDFMEFHRRDDALVRVGWQVKLASKDLDADEVLDVIRALAASTDISHGVVCVARVVPVRGIGHLAELDALCALCEPAGVDASELVRGLSKNERVWFDRIRDAVGSTDEAAVALLHRLRVKQVGTDSEVRAETLQLLASKLPEDCERLLDRLEVWMRRGNGAVRITPRLIHDEVLRPLYGVRYRVNTHQGRREARAAYLDAVVRSVERRRPLARLAESLLTLPDEAYLGAVYVRPVVVMEGLHERAPSTLETEWVRTPDARLAITGALGTGKSVALEHLSADLATRAIMDDDEAVPILIHARELRDGLWRTAFATRMQFLPEDAEAILAGRWRLLVDGIDEAGRLDAWGAIADVCERWGGHCLAVVTAGQPIARPPKDYKVVRLCRWAAIELEQFFARWAVVDPGAVTAVRQAIANSSIQLSLLQNPLMATLCVLVATDKDVDVPSRRSALLAQICGMLFSHWTRQRSASDAALRPWAEFVGPLGELALAYLQGGGVPMSDAQVMQALATVVPDGEVDVWQHARWKVGLLIRTDDNQNDFVQRPLAEYLAAKALVADRADAWSRHVNETWALEPTRIALEILADRGETRRVLEAVSAIAARTVEGVPGLDVTFLRPFLVAIRVVTDLGDAAAPVAEVFAEALYHVIADETSCWVGDVVADEVQSLAFLGGPCWEALLERLRPLAARSSEGAEAWYAARPEREAEYWIGKLLHRSAGVRAIAVSRLAEHVDDASVLRLLLDEIHDAGFDFWGPPPALLAGAALRSVKRDALGPELDTLRSVATWRNPLPAAAAALALLPHETDPDVLARALERVADSLPTCIDAVEALARDPAGRAALDKNWSAWKERPPRRASHEWGASDLREPPPPSIWLRPRIANTCAAAFSRLSKDDLRLLTAHARYTHGHPLAEALFRDDELIAKLDLREIPEHAQLFVGHIAVRSSELRDRLIAMWTDEPLRPAYPGISLEPLVPLDERVARIYAEWLPRSPYVQGHVNGVADPHVEALRQPAVWDAARRTVVRLVDDITHGRGAPGAGRALSRLALIWSDDPELVAALTRSLDDDADGVFGGAALAFTNVPLRRATHANARAALIRGIRARLLSLRGQDAHSQRLLDAMWWVKWADDAGLAPDLYDELRALARTSNPLGYVVGAVLLPLLPETDAVDLATRMAHAGATLTRDELNDELLRRYVSVAEDAWVGALLQAVTSTAVLSSWGSLRLLNFVSHVNRAKIADALEHSPIAGSLLYWIARQGRPFEDGCPADLIREISFAVGR